MSSTPRAQVTRNANRPRLFAAVLALSLLALPVFASGAAVAHAAVVSSSEVTFKGHHGGGGGGGGGCTGNTTTPTSSTNWAGYAAETCLSSPTSNVVTDVKGTWVQPSVSCTSKGNSYAAFWVGIDGYSSSTVEQTGTDSDCSGSTASYYAWYEFYPAYPVNLPNPVHPGDTITAEVSYSGGLFTTTVTDVTATWSFSISQTVNNAQRSSAEWIAEAPSSGHVLPLANFATVQFTGCTATINGTTGPIVDSAWQAASITMVGHSYTKATTSGLGTGSESFSVTWDHS